MSTQEKKDSTRDKLCAFIADVGVDNATELSSRLNGLLKQNNITVDDPLKILIGFTFMNWGIANGVWSTLKNTNLCRDLMATSQRAFALRVARKIKEDECPEDIAFYAVQIDEEFRSFIRNYYIERIKELDRQGFSPNARAVLFIALEWIQENTGLKDSDLDKVIPTFIVESVDLDKMTSVAMQLLHAEETRKKKGILRRLIGK
jgi:hypothetical protein